jgi:hypothetical protein
MSQGNWEDHGGNTELDYAYKQVEKRKQLQRFWNVKQADVIRKQRLDLEEEIQRRRWTIVTEIWTSIEVMNVKIVLKALVAFAVNLQFGHMKYYRF